MPSGKKDEFMVDAWEPRIRQTVRKLLDNFPLLNIRFIRNSWLKHHPAFRKILIETIKYPEVLAEIFKRNTDKKVLPGAVYASPVCKKCHCARNSAKVVGKKGFVKFKCCNCGTEFGGNASEFDYWWYHKPLFLARMEIFRAHLAISGGDHYNEGDFVLRQAMAEKFSCNFKMPDMLFSPLLLTPEGKRMSKSQGNARHGDMQKIINLADHIDSRTLLCPEDALLEKLFI
jgi:lysyl-tRNA synthetase class I